MTNDTFRTHIFKSFKNEFSMLSRLNWVIELSIKAIRTNMSVLPYEEQDKYIGNLFSLHDFDSIRLNIDIKTFIKESDHYIEHLRMLLLVKGCASLEEYIHRYVKYYIIHIGYIGKKYNKLNEIGEVIAGPALKSNLHDSLNYVEKLMKISFGETLQKVSEAYQIRCAAAHNGGIIDFETAKKIPKFAKRVGDRILISWNELHIFLDSIYNIAEKIELCIDPRFRKRIEVNWLIQDIIDRKDIIVDNKVKEITAGQAKDLLIKNYNYRGAPDKKTISLRFGLPNP